MATKRKNRAGLKKARRNPRKVAGKSTTLKNMASVTVTKLPNGVVKITGRKMAGKRNGLVGTYRVADKPGGRSTFYPNMRTALKAAQRLANRTGVAEEIRRVTSQYGDDEFDRKVWPQDLRKR